MKKYLLLMLMATTLSAYSQKTDLSTVNTVKPKKGQKMAFEAAYKVHIAKFHKADNRTAVYEIMSGPSAGSYHLVNSGRSFSDLDKDRPDAAAHSLDLDKTFFPLLDETMNGTYRFVDSLSIHPDTTADKFIVSVRHLNPKMVLSDYYKEVARAAKINSMMKTPFFQSLSVNVYDQLWDGSDQVTVSVRSLKDGFKSLEANYYGANPPGTPTFRDEYVKAHGYDDWEKRVKLLEDAVVTTEQYIMRLRKDLSSQ